MRIAAFVAGVAAALVSTIAAADSLSVAEIGSFHIGGRAVSLVGLPTRNVVFTAGSAPIKVDPNGDFEVEQMRELRQARPPEGALSPLALGRCRRAWPRLWARYPEIFTTEPLFRTKKQAWEDFRIGAVGSYRLAPSERVALPGQLFPTEAFDQFMKQSVPRWSSTDVQTQAAYNQLVQKVCPCVIIVHSQGGNFGFNAALAAPDKVKALVVIEPSGAPSRRRPAAGRSRVCRTSSSGGILSARARSGRASSRRHGATPTPFALKAASPTGGICRRWASPETATC
jgi:hypothetical protein